MGMLLPKRTGVTPTSREGAGKLFRCATICFISYELKSSTFHAKQFMIVRSDFILFISPESKAQVSFSDQNLSLSVNVVGIVINFSHFHTLLQNHWANFNQTLVKGIQVCSN